MTHPIPYLAVLLIAACAQQPSYFWSGGDPSTFNSDFASCEQQTLSAPISTRETERGARIMLACMRTKGWTLSAQ